MPQPIVRRIAHRAVQLAIVAAGIFVVMLVFSRQAHAATDPPPPPGPANSSALSPVSTASSVVGSTVNAASHALTGQSGPATAGASPASTSSGATGSGGSSENASPATDSAGTENVSSGTGTSHSGSGTGGLGHQPLRDCPVRHEQLRLGFGRRAALVPSAGAPGQSATSASGTVDKAAAGAALPAVGDGHVPAAADGWLRDEPPDGFADRGAAAGTGHRPRCPGLQPVTNTQTAGPLVPTVTQTPTAARPTSSAKRRKRP